MNNGDPNKSMVIISAPKGTTLEVGEEEEGDCLLKMDASGKGDIKVYTCKASTGVKELEPKKSWFVFESIYYYFFKYTYG